MVKEGVLLYLCYQQSIIEYSKQNIEEITETIKNILKYLRKILEYLPYFQCEINTYIFFNIDLMYDKLTILLCDLLPISQKALLHNLSKNFETFCEIVINVGL